MPTKILSGLPQSYQRLSSIPAGDAGSIGFPGRCKHFNPAALSVEMPQQVKYLEPFGTDNPAPIFGLYEMRLKEIVPVGGGKHLRLIFEKKNANIPVEIWHDGSRVSVSDRGFSGFGRDFRE